MHGPAPPPGALPPPRPDPRLRPIVRTSERRHGRPPCGMTTASQYSRQSDQVTYRYRALGRHQRHLRPPLAAELVWLAMSVRSSGALGLSAVQQGGNVRYTDCV